MASEGQSPAVPEKPVSPQKEEQPAHDATGAVSNGIKQSQSNTPEPQQAALADHQDPRELVRDETPDNLAELDPFDWDDFEKRYEQALVEADQHEASILEQAEKLSKVWASTASAHDNERAVKRLRSQSRYVNMAEANMLKKQEHYEQVIQAFESALALLRSQ